MKKKRKEFCDQAIKKLNKGAIFIYSDEFQYEVDRLVYHKLRVTKLVSQNLHKQTKLKPLIQFSFMQQRAITIEPVMRPQYIWEAKTKKDQETIYALLIENNTRILKDIERQQERTEIPGIIEYQYMQVRNVIKYLVIIVVN